ncbi:MAG TPA: ATP-binding cassette domain-containing protein, partial [Desertimonas sp.]|nr:ATP-binding cassette domain-containing protein [Desertimonas sp.]
MTDRATATRGTEGTAPFVQLRDVVVAFGGLLAVLGPNGAGKTTLFNVIAGDLHPTSGRVAINGV